MSDSLIPSFLVSNVSKLLRSLTKNERCERIAQVAHQKWVTMSDLLRSLRGNERLWANCSGCSPKMSEWVIRSCFWGNRSVAHFWAKSGRFAWKTDEQIPSPDCKKMWVCINWQYTVCINSIFPYMYFVTLYRLSTQNISIIRYMF